MAKKLYKSRKNRMLAGVCGGVADYFNIDPTIVRLVWVLVAVFKGIGLILYIIAALVMPESEDGFFSSDENIDNLKSANVEEEEKSSKKKKSKKSSGGPHSDEEFDSYFTKN